MLEIFQLNENGAGWVSLENATPSELLDLELAIITNAEIKLFCVECHIEIPAGIGNKCAKHTTFRTCNICEMPHGGLYCNNCLNGTRVNISKKENGYRFVSVLRLTPVSCKMKFARF